MSWNDSLITLKEDSKLVLVSAVIGSNNLKKLVSFSVGVYGSLLSDYLQKEKVEILTS